MAAICDVVVVGGGPAGAATALRLAAAGRSVSVLERSRFGQPRVGETLAPVVQPLLHDLGMWSRFVLLRPLPSWGTRSIWDDPAPVEHSHVLSGYRCGWHVDRRAFDRMLADAAARAGAQVRTGTSVVECRHDGVAWTVRCADGQTIRSHLVIDATGRRAGISRGLGAQRIRFDRLVAITAHWDDVDVAGEEYLLLESAADGWWYTAPLPANCMVGMFLTDADLCRRNSLHGTAQWHDRLRRAPTTAARVGSEPPRTAPRVHSAVSHRTVRAGDARPWLSVGDAALGVDPLTGSGVARALRTAEAAANTAGQMLDCPDEQTSLLAAYESARDGECTAYLLDRERYYGAVQRFDTPFWTRRRRNGARVNALQSSPYPTPTSHSSR